MVFKVFLKGLPFLLFLFLVPVFWFSSPVVWSSVPHAPPSLAARQLVLDAHAKLVVHPKLKTFFCALRLCCRIPECCMSSCVSSHVIPKGFDEGIPWHVLYDGLLFCFITDSSVSSCLGITPGVVCCSLGFHSNVRRFLGVCWILRVLRARDLALTMLAQWFSTSSLETNW